MNSGNVNLEMLIRVLKSIPSPVYPFHAKKGMTFLYGWITKYQINHAVSLSH